MTVERETRSTQEYKRQLAQIRRRYHTDPEFRKRLRRMERESSTRRKKGQVKDPVVAKKWRLTRLEHQIEDTAEELLDHKIVDLVPLFLAGEEKVTQVYLSPNGYLCLRPGIKAKFKIDVQSAYDLFGYRKVCDSLKGVSQSLRLKK